MCRNTQVLDIYRKEGDIILKTTAKGICLNLNESEYYFKYKGLIFYFSSEFYKKKFADEIVNYNETETLKLQVKYNIIINFDILFMLSLYKKIEKRVFSVFYEINKKEITPSFGLITNILMY